MIESWLIPRRFAHAYNRDYYFELKVQGGLASGWVELYAETGGFLKKRNCPEDGNGDFPCCSVCR
jgi:hypothetical protein